MIRSCLRTSYPHIYSLRTGRLYISSSPFSQSPDLGSSRRPRVNSHKRRIIIAFDGTGQSSTRGEPSISSNISRFCRALSTARNGVDQVVFYQSGVGTGSLGKIFGSIAGFGLDDHVLDAYLFLANNYLPGDEVSIFGFSRGAFAARILSGLITTIGVFKKSWLWGLKVAYKAYCKGDVEYANYVRDLHTGWKRGRTHHVKIKVVGCFDTVASIGLPKYSWVTSLGLNNQFEFYDPKLRYGIENAFHALSLDEMRYPFSPTLWYLPKGADGEPLSGINLKQVWFPGVHTNVGGGYADYQLSNLSFAWMISKSIPFLDFEPEYLNMCLRLHWNPGSIRSSLRTSHGFDKVYRGWAKGKIYDSYRSHRIIPLLWWKYRKPGQYGETDGVLGDTQERMHTSVRVRWLEDESWRPTALRGFSPHQREDGTWFWAGPKGVNMEEARFDENPKGFEYLLRHGFP